MVLSFVAARAWVPTQRLADTRPMLDLEKVFPKAFGDWRIDDSLPVRLVSPDQQYYLDKIYNQTLSRTYVNARGERIMLAVAYGGDQSDATRAHRPEVCYPVQGFEILMSERATVATPFHSVRARRLVARQGARVEPITYWVTVGERIAVSGPEQKLAQLAYSTRGMIPDGMLIRVSTIGNDFDEAFRLQDSFLASLAEALQPSARAQVIGSTGS